MATEHPTPSSQALPSSDDPLLSSPPQNHFSTSPSLALSPEPRVEHGESREADWVTDSSPSASPSSNPPSVASSAARHQAGTNHAPHRRHRDVYWPRRIAFPRPRNLRRRFEEDGGEDLESGRSEQARNRAERRGRDWNEGEFHLRRGNDSCFQMLRLVLMGMCMVLLCMLGAFFGIWFGVLGKGKSIL